MKNEPFSQKAIQSPHSWHSLCRERSRLTNHRATGHAPPLTRLDHQSVTRNTHLWAVHTDLLDTRYEDVRKLVSYLFIIKTNIYDAPNCWWVTCTIIYHLHQQLRSNILSSEDQKFNPQFVEDMSIHSTYFRRLCQI